MIKWSSRNEGFEDKKRTGRPKVLNEAAKKVLKKAKYKRGNSTRQLSQQLASKGLVGGKNTVWRFMKSKGWRPLRRQKKPLLTAKQPAARLKFATQYKSLTTEALDDFLFSDECPKYLFQLPNPKNDIVWGCQESQVPPAYRGKKSSKWIIWGGMTGRGLTELHFIPQGQTLTANYYINNKLEKEVKPLLRRKKGNEAIDKRKLFSSNRHMTFVQDGAPSHAAKATQAWCKRNLPNFIEKASWPPNLPDINPVENRWSIMDEVVYKDPTPKTMKDLKRRLQQAGRISRSPRYDLSHSVPQRLQNVIKNKGGHAGY